MRKLCIFGLLLAAFGGSLPAQTPSGAYSSPASGSGIASPSSLTTFFAKYYGLAPQDCGNATCTIAGAKGDTHVYFDCGQTTNNHLTCGSAHFASTDVGKWYESTASGGGFGGAVPVVNAGTITAFNSSTDVTVSVTAGTTYTNTRTAFGTDDDAAMQNWATFMVQSPTLGVPPATRGGYLPQGGYAIKQPLQIKYPGCSTPGVCTAGEGGPNSGNGGTLRPSLWLAGQGTASTFIYVRTAASFTWPTQASNTAAVYVKDFDFSALTNFAVIADFSAHTTSGITSPGAPAGIMNDNSTHAMWSGLWIQGFHNSTNNLCGFATSANDFESSYSYSAFEDNDFNGCPGVNNSTATMEKIKFDTDFFENPLQSQNIRIGAIGGAVLTLKQITFLNCHSLTANVASINFLNNVTTSLGETVQFYGWRQQNGSGASSLGVVVNTTTNLNVDFHGSYFEDTNGAAGNFLIDNTSANATFNVYGGALRCASCTNVFNNAGNIFIYGTALSGPTVANVQTGAGFTYSFIPVKGANGGWSGKGGIQGTWAYSNQGTAAANGQVALSAGWGTTATVTAAAGFAQHGRFTLTSSGTGQAANPTITWTLPDAAPTATTLCLAQQVGGTQTQTSIQQTTLSATAPIFTFNGTPVAGNTVIVDIVCGP